MRKPQQVPAVPTTRQTGRYCAVQGMSRERFDSLEGQELHTASYDIALPYMVFALIASRQDDIILSERKTISRHEHKTATKFGKTWIAEGLRTHITIRIGERARRHLNEQADRRHHETGVASGRLQPTEHWVSQHERRYKNGKVVLVRAHQRGQKPDPSLPRIVIGPTQ